MEQRRLSGKVAIVTGSGRGIGKSAALRLAHEGADLMIADIDTSSADRTTQEILAADRRALAYSIDLAKISLIQPMVDRVVNES